MGQYYKPIILAPKQDNQAEQILAWLYSHDYDCGLKLMEHSWLGNRYVQTFEKMISPEGLHHKSRVVWAGDYADHEENEEGNLYDFCGDINKIQPKETKKDIDYPYIVNHSKKLYVDKQTIPDTEEEWGIHPLPLLTCEGNGRGGGDFRGENELIGSWARDIISVEKDIPADYQRLEIIFREE